MQQAALETCAAHTAEVVCVRVGLEVVAVIAVSLGSLTSQRTAAHVSRVLTLFLMNK